MKQILALLAAIVMLMAGAHAAAAFSTSVQPDGVSGGASIADPDEQMPGFMVSPDQARDVTQSYGAPADQLTMPSMRENDAGAAAFNQAYTHLQNR